MGGKRSPGRGGIGGIGGIEENGVEMRDGTIAAGTPLNMPPALEQYKDDMERELMAAWRER